jgi:hypothetical protein
MDGDVSRGGYSRQARRSAEIVAGSTAHWHIQNPSNTVSAGKVVTFADASGNGRTITQGTSSKQPTDTPNTYATFDGTDDQLDTPVATWGNVITASAHTIYLAVTPLAWSTTAAMSSAHTNHGMLADNAAYLGMSLRNVAGSEVNKGVTLPATLNTPMVITWRHSGGTVYGSVNGGAEVSAACGDVNASGLLRPLRLGIGFAVYANFRFFECVTYNTSHSAGDIAQTVSAIRARHGI